MSHYPVRFGALYKGLSGDQAAFWEFTKQIEFTPDASSAMMLTPSVDRHAR